MNIHDHSTAALLAVLHRIYHLFDMTILTIDTRLIEEKLI